MKSSFNSAKKSRQNVGKKILLSLLIFITLFSFLITPLKTVQAQAVVTDPIVAAWTSANGIWSKLSAVLKTLWQKAGSVAFQQTARTALNKIAYDTATWLGSGQKGQKPLFITKNWDDYLAQVGDEAAGRFIESFATQLARPISTQCQNAYQECIKPCLGDQNTDMPTYEITEDGETIQTGYSSESTDQAYCIQTCKQQITACDNKMASQYALSSSTSNSLPSAYQSSAINVCQPSSLQAKIKIGLGLVEQQRPGTPNCTASEMVSNWGDEVERYRLMQAGDFLKDFASFFSPSANDLGIYMSMREGMLAQQTIMDENTKLNLAANKGWLNKTNAAKELIGIPNDAETKAQIAESSNMNQLVRTTGDIVVDAANIFLNQFAITGFKTLMSSLGEKVSGGPDLTNNEGDYSVSYGEGKLKEVTAQILKPNFGVQSDYDILSQLSICPDPAKPGPTDCVIDNKLAQGISEKKTIAEAIAGGYINGGWQVTQDTVSSAYSLRNIKILIKYRILPIGWEEAIKRAYANQNNIKKVTVSDLISCFDPNDSYNQFSAGFDRREQAWCRALVDPNWVLKAPLNYCEKEGSSAQILNTTVMPSVLGLNGNPYSPSILNITRAENYCGDEKTCIKEKSDGSCEVYGYCNEEQRTWNFSSETCDPIYNTCQSFTNIISGKSVSYLQNTLNYEGCNPESAGCRQYSMNGSYATTTGIINWSASQSAYLNRNTATCDSKDEACTELLRVKSTWAANLVMDADFNNEEIGDSSTGTSHLNDWAYWSSPNTINNSRIASIVDSGQELGDAGGKVLKLVATRVANNTNTATVGTYSDLNFSLLPDNFELIPGQAYTVSAKVYLTEGDSVQLYLGDSASGATQSTQTLNGWETLQITRIAEGAFSQPLFGINAYTTSDNVSVYIKDVKFELSNFATGYNGYGTDKVYEKIIPPYLEASCYNNISSAIKDYRLRADAPAECSNFARKCNREEVGCELFKNVSTALTVPAQVSIPDYCPKECLGYDTYISRGDYFNSPQAVNIIPKNTQTCRSEAAGCSEFTNLDAVNQGGENKEYYTAIKQCIKPSATLCGSFYSWEGVDSGYQLRAYSLQRDEDGAPAVSADDSALCSAEIYNLSLSDPAYNEDCREFYNAAGQVSYHLMSRTITCSENCHAYRMSGNNIDKTLLTQADCEASENDSHWDAAAGACYTCLNGGNWDDQLSACIYQAIPGEGKTCQAAQNGCREYNGNSGNNVRMLASYDFESGAQGWNSNCTGGIELTEISNNKDGHSLLYRDGANNCAAIGIEEDIISKTPIIKNVFASSNVGAQLKVSNMVSQGKAYSLRFIAKAAVDTNPQIYFYNNDSANPQRSYFASSTLIIKGGGEWNIYQANLENLDHAITPNELLLISANHDFYFDDVVLTEITDRYYLIKDTSYIPDMCYYDDAGQYQGANYNLGCTQYLDRDKYPHNLRKFSKLCSDSAIGCEQVIATQNYSPYGSGIWNDANSSGSCESDEPDCIKVDRDKAIYAVYNASKACNSADLGCSRLGMSLNGTNDWADVYKENNPNLYDKILCSQGEVGCEEWKAGDGALNYFRDPGNEACQYRASQDLSIIGKAWYKIPVKRCDLNANGSIEGLERSGRICTADNYCSSAACVIDTNDYPCSTSYLQTFGLGGAGNQVPTPDQQAGLCEANAAGCTEYIDPVSQYIPNLVVNPNYTIGNNGAEGWDAAHTQAIILDPNKLYIFSVRNNSSTVPTTLSFTTGVKELLSDNSLATTTTSIVIPALTNQSRIFTSLNNSRVIIEGGDVGKIIELKSAITNYQLQQKIDKSSCGGVYNLDAGCVLFNERNINGASGLADLSSKWDAQISINKKAPTLCNSNYPGSCTANQIIKVTPNRVCAKWLDCLTYAKDPDTGARTCYAVGECTRLDDKNECANFEEAPSGTISFEADGRNKNATGYYLLNKYHLANMTEVGFNTDAHYDFEDNVPALSCQLASGVECSYTKNIVSDLLVREPNNSPTDYPAHGASFLRVPASFSVSPQSGSSWIGILQDREYFINYLLNTKDTGLGARIRIIGRRADASQTTILDEIVYSNSGWSRQILPFNSLDISSIRIYLGSDTLDSDREVYFDDINIEPVLSVGQDATGEEQYTARECRLYPTNDSLTCINKDNNVLQDGWEGYCLEHDPNNKAVCLMWYPVDAISSAQTTRNLSGYRGKFPLNYCTEVNGNFDVVEKRKPFLFKSIAPEGDCDSGSLDDEIPWQGVHGGNEGDFAACGDQYVGFLERSTYLSASHNHCAADFWCIPKMSGTTYIEYQESKNGGPFSLLRPYSYENLGTARPLFRPNPEEDYSVGMAHGSDNDGIRVNRIYVTNSAGWYAYDGFDSINSESTFADPAIRVLDYDHLPADDEGLKLITGRDEDKLYRLTCNNFVQMVDFNGDNRAWALRTSNNSVWATTTPAYFVDRITDMTYFYYGEGFHQLAAYGRNRQDAPFGAALWPDSFNLLSSDAVKLSNQFSVKNNEDVLAGRPYGCSNYKKNIPGNTTEFGNGCSQIGYCSLDPNVYCLMGNNSSTDIISRKTCADGGYGTCIPLWNNYLGADDVHFQQIADFRVILKNLFLKSYNSFIYSNGAYTTNNNAAIDADPPLCANGVRPVANYNNANTAALSFCSIPPAIGNPTMSYNEQIIATGSPFYIAKKGIYSLKFTTNIDPEQQPLKDIYIYWGDGSEQLITGQDSRPKDPHVFYHYYKETGPTSFMIQIRDNWGEEAEYGSCTLRPGFCVGSVFDQLEFN